MNLTKNKNLMFGLGAAALIAAGYFLFFNTSAPADLTVGDTTSPAELLFINLAGQLEPVAFNGGILSDARFESLVDIRTAVIPETSGRPDPFAPLFGTKK